MGQQLSHKPPHLPWGPLRGSLRGPVELPRPSLKDAQVRGKPATPDLAPSCTPSLPLPPTFLSPALRGVSGLQSAGSMWKRLDLKGEAGDKCQSLCPTVTLKCLTVRVAGNPRPSPAWLQVGVPSSPTRRAGVCRWQAGNAWGLFAPHCAEEGKQRCQVKPGGTCTPIRGCSKGTLGPQSGPGSGVAEACSQKVGLDDEQQPGQKPQESREQLEFLFHCGGYCQGQGGPSGWWLSPLAGCNANRPG